MKTYLDSTGRPTVVMVKEGVTDRHGGEVIVRFHLSFFLLLPLLPRPFRCDGLRFFPLPFLPPLSEEVR